MKLPLFIARDRECIIVRGNAYNVLHSGGFRAIYSGSVHGFMLDAHREADLLAYLDASRIPYRLQGVAA